MFQSMLQVAKLYTATYAVQTPTLVAVTLSRMVYRQHSVLTQPLTVQLTQSIPTMTFPMVSYRSKLRATFIKSTLAVLSEVLFLEKDRSFYFAIIRSCNRANLLSRSCEDETTKNPDIKVILIICQLFQTLFPSFNCCLFQ